jgi:hypothetical protein
MKTQKMKNLFIILCGLCAFVSKATHNRSGEILYERIPPYFQTVGNGTVAVYTYSIIVIKYHDNGPGIADRCVDTVHFGDGTQGVAPRSNGTATAGCCTNIPCGEIIYNSPNYTVKKSIYTIIHTYPGPGVYTISSSDPNRTQGSNNIPNSVGIPFFISAQLIINSYTGVNSSPILNCPPINIAQCFSCYEDNVCAYDAEGDSLSFELTTCRGADGNTIPGYFFPATGAGGSFSIHPTTGLLTWCSPQTTGMYNVVIVVKEWRRQYCDWPYELIGSVMRDMEIMVTAASNVSFSCTNPVDTCISSGSTLVTTLTGNSSNIFSVSFLNSAGISPLNLTTTTSAPSSFTSTLTWQPSGYHVQKQPHRADIIYNVSPFKYYRHLNITVVPPSPTITIVNQTNAVTLNWQDFSSSIPNFKGYYVYRQIGVNTWSHAACETGVPPSSGFQYLGWTPAPASSFMDINYNGLSNGLTANYIVTAMTNDCQESFASDVQTVSLIVGLDKNKFLQETAVYPNPFRGRIEVDLNENYTGAVKTFIYSADGRLVYRNEKEKVNGKMQHELPGLEAGIYLVCISTDYGDVHRKLLKE